MEISHKKSLILLTVASVVVFFLVYLIGHTIFQHKSYNFMVKQTSVNKAASDDIILVVIDNESLAKLGRWPWKRTVFLEIFDYLENYTSTKVYGFDAVIIAPDTDFPENDKRFSDNIGRFEKLVAGVGFMYEPFKEISDKDIFNEMLFFKSDINFTDKRSTKYKTQSPYKSFTPFLKEYFYNIQNLGAVNTLQDADGYIRRVDQVISYNGRLYPSLALLMFSKATGIKDFTITDNYILAKNDKHTLKMPIVNSNGVAYSFLSYYKTHDGVYSHRKISASDIIESSRNIKIGKKPKIDPEIFNNKIVFVGSNANSQALQDVKRTPISDTFAGLDIQATNFNNIYENKFFRGVSPLYSFITILTVFILVLLLICTLPIPVALMCTSLVMFLYFIFTFIMYHHRIGVGLIMPEVFMLIAIGFGYSYRYLVEGRKKEKIQSAMGKYISKDVMKNVVSNIDSVKLGGKRACVTVLFADIRGFTSISEQLSAEEVTNILNEYFSAIAPVIEKHNGILNKFMGDAVLAVFGEPIKNENHAVDAVKCADEMLKKVKQLQGKWLDEGKPKIEIGIGISTGEAFVGNIGSEERLEYTVIGDTVNTASRIENYNKVYKTKFLISEETFLRVQKYVDVIKIREVTIRGKSKKINIYEVLRIWPE